MVNSRTSKIKRFDTGFHDQIERLRKGLESQGTSCPFHTTAQSLVNQKLKEKKIIDEILNENKGKKKIKRY